MNLSLSGVTDIKCFFNNTFVKCGAILPFGNIQHTHNMHLFPFYIL